MPADSFVTPEMSEELADRHRSFNEAEVRLEEATAAYEDAMHSWAISVSPLQVGDRCQRLHVALSGNVKVQRFEVLEVYGARNRMGKPKIRYKLANVKNDGSTGKRTRHYSLSELRPDRIEEV